MLDYIVMQMRKGNREKGYWTPLSPIVITYGHFIACMVFFSIRMAILKRTTFGGFAFSVHACNRPFAAWVT